MAAMMAYKMVSTKVDSMVKLWDERRVVMKADTMALL